MANKRVLITGASGLLGRAALAAFKQSEWTVLGTTFSRVREGTVRVDICHKEEIIKIIEDFKPAFIIHCAAQRFPDKVNQDPEGALKLNVEATKNLATLAANAGITMLYISTNYVFDGTKPPYSEEDEPNPLNIYGQTKLDGEKVTLEASAGHIVLRVPVLYGSVEYLGESAVTVLLELLFKTEKKPLSDYEIRFPSHVDDIASVCLSLLELKLTNSSIGGIYHWGGKERMTKYGMISHIAEVFQLSKEHIIPDPNPVPGAPRPHNSQLSNVKLEALGIGKHTPFREGIKAALQPWVQSFQS